MVLQRYFINCQRDIAALGKEQLVLVPASVGSLLDGWIVKYDILIQPDANVTGANSVGVASFGLETHPLTSQIYDIANSINYNDLFANWYADVAEAGFFHGGNSDMALFYLLFNSNSLDAGSWTHIKKVMRRVINAGALIYEDGTVRQTQTGGTAMTFAGMIYNTQTEIVVAPERWDRWAKHKGPMKFVGYLGA